MTSTYDLKDVERRLGEDDRTAELGVRLVEHGQRLFVRGEVSSEASREHVLEIVREMCPKADLVDEMSSAEEALGRRPDAPEVMR